MGMFVGGGAGTAGGGLVLQRGRCRCQQGKG